MKPSLRIGLAGVLAGAIATNTAQADETVATEEREQTDDAAGGRRLRARFIAGWRMAPGRSPAQVAQGLSMGAELAYQLRSDTDVFVRAEVVGLDQLTVWRIGSSASKAVAALPAPALESTSLVGVRRRFGRVAVESGVGMWAQLGPDGEPVARAALAQVGATARVACVRQICLDVGATVRTTFGAPGPGWAVLPTFALTSR
jgi:hypothetical protein